MTIFTSVVTHCLPQVLTVLFDALRYYEMNGAFYCCITISRL